MDWLFSLQTSTSNTIITITDILGKQILKKNVIQKISNFQIDNNGVYIISIESNEGIKTFALIVSK